SARRCAWRRRSPRSSAAPRSPPPPRHSRLPVAVITSPASAPVPPHELDGARPLTFPLRCYRRPSRTVVARRSHFTIDNKLIKLQIWDMGPEHVFDELTKALKDPADFVDFDLPSALKEWKLGYYIPIKRNIYLTKKRVEDDGIFCSCSLSSESSVTCGKDCQCGMLFSCCSSNCKCENKCANKSFQLRPLFKTELIKTEKCGFGLIAEDEIKKGEFVIEYVGEVAIWSLMRQTRGTSPGLSIIVVNKHRDAEMDCGWTDQSWNFCSL
uniref:AWS domain-containing protein n=2 Tax=Aegilops tauschii subsp. strangulata TaxID=200361 RepID=A0A453SVE6_AEGTS